MNSSIIKAFNVKFILFVFSILMFLLIVSIPSGSKAGVTLSPLSGLYPMHNRPGCPSPSVAIGIVNTDNYYFSAKCAYVYADGTLASRGAVSSRDVYQDYHNNCYDNYYFTSWEGRAMGPYSILKLYCAPLSANGASVNWSGYDPKDLAFGVNSVYCDSHAVQVGLNGRVNPLPPYLPSSPKIMHPLIGITCNSSFSYTPAPKPVPLAFNVYGSSSCSGTANQTNTITWGSSTNASYYYVYRDGSYIATRYPGGENFSETLTTGTHNYRVLAINANGSMYASPNPLYIYARDCIAPGVPNLTVTPGCNGNQSVNNLSWNSVSGATDYYVYKCEKKGGGKKGGGDKYNQCSSVKIPASQRSYSYNVDYPSTYEYYVRAYKSSNNTYSSPSNRERVSAECCITPTVDIKANGSDSPEPIKKGQSTTLSWTTQDTQTLSINPGISCNLTVPNGTCEVFPFQTTNYRLTAYGVCAGKTNSDDVKVTVDEVVYKGLFIANNIIIHTDRDYILKLLYDPKVITYPPPGFAEILPPVYYQEVAP